MNPEIIFQTILSTPTGEGATEGRNMQKAFNNNFNKAKTLLEQLFSIVSIQVSSENVTQIKVDTSTTPNSLYYTLDPIGTEEPTWERLSTSFASLQGNPSDNIALKQILDSKAAASTVSSLSTTVNQHTTDISNLQTTTTQNTTDIGTIKQQVSTIQQDSTNNVKTEVGSKLYIRYNALLNTVEYSTTGTEESWSSIIATNINFADLTGLPEDNHNIVQYVENKISTAIQGLVTTSELIEHTSNYENPHQVTADQLGLGNVLNEIAELQGAQNLARNKYLTDYLNTEQLADAEVTYISSHYIDTSTIGSFVQVATITGDQTFNTVDGLMITMNTNPLSLPKWYSMVLDDSATTYTIYYNEQLRYYMLGGDV